MLKWLSRLSWKKITAVSGLALALAVLPLNRNAAVNPTRTRSEAALLPQPQPISKEFVTPEGPPQIYLVDHFFGKVGDAVLIHGANLGGLHPQSLVFLNGVALSTSDLVSWTSDYIEFKVPQNASSGSVAVSILGQPAAWAGTFFVTNDTTEAELRLVGANNQAELTAQNISGGNQLLIWLLVISGEGNLIISSNVAAPSLAIFNLPIGRIYQVQMAIPAATAAESTARPVSLLSITKNEGQTFGIARAEISLPDGGLIPVKSHPLYVSF